MAHRSLLAQYFESIRNQTNWREIILRGQRSQTAPLAMAARFREQACGARRPSSVMEGVQKTADRPPGTQVPTDWQTALQAGCDFTECAQGDDPVANDQLVPYQLSQKLKTALTPATSITSPTSSCLVPPSSTVSFTRILTLSPEAAMK